MDSLEEPGVVEFFRGRSIFITGASGFMGKVLVEKLLRSCPGIVKIYILLRQGRKGTIEERLEKMKSFELFDRLKSERPGDLESKLVPLEGDMTELNLGLSIKDRAILIKEVSIVYHVAATVRFDQSLKEAILMNVRGTREVCDLVLDIRTNNPDTILLHVSTAYAHTDRKIVEEAIYPPHADWRRSIETAEHVDKHTLQLLSGRYLDGFPNTYTFTKSLAEHVVNDLCGHGFGGTVIVRPTIVISSAKEPIKGWIDNFNGPTAMLTASGTGIVRISYVNGDIIADYMAVDCAIKGIIVATWRANVDKTLERETATSSGVASIYNISAYNTKQVTLRQMSTMAATLTDQVALRDAIWYPSDSTTSSWTWYYINFMLFQLLPAFIIDSVLNLVGVKQRSLMEIQRKIYTVTIALAFFINNDWCFINNNFLALEEKLPKQEVETFGYDIDNIDILEFFRNGMLGGKKYLLNEDESNYERQNEKIKKLYYLDVAKTWLFYAFMVWLIFFKINIPEYIYSSFYNYVNSIVPVVNN